MLQPENHYDFKKRLLQGCCEDILDTSLKPLPDELILPTGMNIYVNHKDNDPVVAQAVAEFCEYLQISMKTTSKVTANSAGDSFIKISVNQDTGSYKSYHIEVEDNEIIITGHDGRGIAQALYHIENCLTERRAPFLTKGSVDRAPLFYPRMTHSGYAFDDFPSAYLRQIAHAGMDAVLLYTKSIDLYGGSVDANALIARAAKYGIDVYAYSDLKSKYHPDDPNAENYYESTYGRLFAACPGLKGIILVGESIGFPSKDPAASPFAFYENFTDGIPNQKMSADSYPCRDYSQWLSLIMKIIRGHSPDADMVFWTYNFGYAPEEARVSLIRSLPKDISLLVTFEMFERYPIGNAVERCADYTLAFAGPGKYFTSEAQAAKECGIRLYAMSNTGGLTWDIGVIPYEPMPYQWMRRYEKLREAREKWGLCGLMESHHYGFWPSFISDLSREAFEMPTDDDFALDRVLRRRFGDINISELKEALELWSLAIACYTPTVEDQYGAFRVGPSYPMNMHRPLMIPKMSEGIGPEGFTHPFYPTNNAGGLSPSSVRIRPEIESLKKMIMYMEQGMSIIKAIPNPNKELLYLINLGAFITCCTQTGICAKEKHLLITRLKAEEDIQKSFELCDQLEELLNAERKNVEVAIPLARTDSRLGWEPRMGYCCAEEQLNWKLRQLEYLEKVELRAYRAALGNGDTYEYLYFGQF